MSLSPFSGFTLPGQALRRRGDLPPTETAFLEISSRTLLQNRAAGFITIHLIYSTLSQRSFLTCLLPPSTHLCIHEDSLDGFYRMVVRLCLSASIPLANLWTIPPFRSHELSLPLGTRVTTNEFLSISLSIMFSITDVMSGIQTLL